MVLIIFNCVVFPSPGSVSSPSEPLLPSPLKKKKKKKKEKEKKPSLVLVPVFQAMTNQKPVFFH
jgi:hypothetical protein